VPFTHNSPGGYKDSSWGWLRCLYYIPGAVAALAASTAVVKMLIPTLVLECVFVLTLPSVSFLFETKRTLLK
jgi:hypothetical protein